MIRGRRGIACRILGRGSKHDRAGFVPGTHGDGTMMFLDQSIEPYLSWEGAVDALRRGHALPRAEVGDLLTGCTDGELLCRSASIEGLGAGTKCVTIRPQNPRFVPPKSTVQGLFLLFAEGDGAPRAIIDGPLLTKWKTVADSLLGTTLLGRPAPRSIAILGGGALASGLTSAYSLFFPSIREIRLWSRSGSLQGGIPKLKGCKVHQVSTISEAIRGADIISCATSAMSPVLCGDEVGPGTHVDLIGAHNRQMREGDDALISKAQIFVDCRETTIDHIGELCIPIETGTIGREAVLGDLYDLVGAGTPIRSEGGVTLFKNGGGGHLDLMMASYFMQQAQLREEDIARTRAGV